jgi:hypothetical protein
MVQPNRPHNDSAMVHRRNGHYIQDNADKNSDTHLKYLLLHKGLISSDFVKCFKAKLTETEKLRNDLSVIKICLAKLYVSKLLRIICIVGGDINLL